MTGLWFLGSISFAPGASDERPLNGPEDTAGRQAAKASTRWAS